MKRNLFKTLPIATLLWSLFAFLLHSESAAAAVQGRVVAWGANGNGQSTVPTNLGLVRAIAAGGFHSLAVRTDGTVVAWGHNGSGQSTVPPGLSDVVAVSAGGSFSVALRSNGTVVAWGANELGQTAVPPGLNNAIAISSGWNVSLALRADGTVIGWGQNNYGQTAPPVGAVNLKAVSSTEAHSLGLRVDGAVLGWGASPNVPPGLADIVAISANGYHDLALRNDGTVVAWGDNTLGQSTIPPGLSGVALIAAGYNHSLAVRSNGLVVAWGSNQQGQSTVPAGLTNVVAIAGGYSHSLAITSTNVVEVDDVPPNMVSIMPVPNATVRSLSQVTLSFSEPVTNVNASDLRINESAAESLTVHSPAQFTFHFPQPSTGTVLVAWAPDHGITDFATNSFSGGSWSYNLDTNIPPSVVTISEFMAANGGSLLDEDGESSDWIEIYNPGPDPVLLEDWSLTDDPGWLGKWRFPAKTLGANAYLVVFASGKERYNPEAPLHTNFKLDADGGYLALARPDGTIMSQFAPVFPPQRSDVSFGTSREVISPPLLLMGASAKVFVPSNGALGLSWTGGEPFDDSGWLATTTGIGYDQGGVGGSLSPLGCWTFDNNSVSTQAVDVTGNNHHGTVVGGVTYTLSGGGRSGNAGDRAMDFGPCGSGNYVSIADVSDGWLDSATVKNQVTFSLWIRGDQSQPCVNSVFHLTGGINGGLPRYVANAHLPWENSIIYWDTSGVLSGQRVSILVNDSTKWKGQWNHYAFIKNGNSKQIWQNGIKILDEVNATPLQNARSFFIGSGPNGEWSYGGLIDDFAVWDTALSQEQVQALAAGGSPMDFDNYSSLLGSDIRSLMQNKNASAFVRVPLVLSAVDFDSLLLRIRYDDGFVCWVNGVEVARRNAPEPVMWDSAAGLKRTRTQARAVEEINISGAISSLRVGTNILAFQALNSSAGDTELLLVPELVAARSAGHVYFSSPTPGATNGAGFGGFVEDTEFSADRGFYFAPTNVLITSGTPGAYIVYTRDGSLPTPSNGTRINAENLSLSPTAIVAIATTTLLRAAAFKEGWRETDVDTHTYVFPVHVGTQTRPGWIASTWPGGAPADFEVDARVVDTAIEGYRFTNALLSIPTLSIVTPSNNLFSSSGGIYANPQSTGPSSERPVSAELIYPDGREGFQIDCGFRIHGGVSRIKTFTPKHSFSLLFRESFGASELDFPLFTNSPVRKFDHLVVRGSSTDSMAVQDGTALNGEPWPRWTRDEASQMRDQWMRDAQRAMGHPSANGIYVHLYLDGLYWGLYNLAERPDDSFAEEYLGGEREEFDVISDVHDLHAGSWAAWDEMFSFASSGLSTVAAMQRIQGNNPDGTRNPLYPVYLDLTNLIDYMILHIAGGADDWPDHNWWAIRKKGPNSEGFRFFVWDQEITNNSLERTRTSHNPFPLFAEVSVSRSPAYLYSQLRANPEFRVLFADRVQRHLFLNGALSVSNNIARWQARHDEIDRAVVGESARWGDHRRPSLPYKREVEWVSNQNWMVTTYFPSNFHVALNRFRTANLYPNISAPVFNQHGGNVSSNFQLTITHTNQGGIIFYTVDGSDPRGAGGVFGNTASPYFQPISVTAPTLVRARVNNGATWSAIVEAQFFPPQDLSKLQLSEIMYNPPMFGTNDGDEVEFIELKNVGTNTLNLSLLTFTRGIQFTFSNGTQLSPGQFFVLARNAALFTARYTNAPLHGLYSGRLDNNGENLSLSTPAGAAELFSVRYDNKEPWPLASDNTGLSLQRMSYVVLATNARNWIAASPTPGSDLPGDMQDADGDGMPNGWELAHQLNPEANDASLDLDEDGLTNYEEFLANTNPADDSDRLVLRVNSAVRMDAVVLSFLASSNRTYSILWRESVEEQGWVNLMNIEARTTNRTVTVTNQLPEGVGSRYYRLTTPSFP